MNTVAFAAQQPESSKIRPASTLDVVARSKYWLQLRWQRDRTVVILVGLSAVLVLFLWVAKAAWYHFSPMIAWFGTGVVFVNALLAGCVIGKQPVFAQAIALTALTVTVLLVVLVLRTAAVGL